MRCAVLGSPVAHSLSPVMHRAAYRELGLDWTYDAVEVGEDDLALFLRSLGDDVRGLSVTAPLKRRLVELVDDRDGDVERLGVANTVVIDDGHQSLHNTDVPGAVDAIREAGLEPRSARVLGGGATAASVAVALARVGVETLHLVVRDAGRAAATERVARSAGLDVALHGLDDPMVDKVDLLVSTLPSGAVGSRSHELVEGARAVFDVVYNPWPTPLAEAGAALGIPVLSGLDLLAHQAALQVALMTGSEVRPQLLRDAALGELAGR